MWLESAALAALHRELPETMVKAPAKHKTGDLFVRLASAAVLIPLGLFVVWDGGVWLALGCVLFAAAMAYEWVRMSASPLMKVFLPLAMLPPLIAALIGPFSGFLALGVCAVLAGAVHPVSRERAAVVFGLIYVAGMPTALFLLREGPWDGAAVALILMGMVWGSDSAAYFSGRGFGGPPLTPESPSKTWSGAVGAVIFTTLCGALAARITGGSLPVWLVTGFLISVFAQMGDFIESRIKRRYGVKDASGLIPGHGGVMDRVDGLGIVCVVAVIALFLFPFLASVLGLSA